MTGYAILPRIAVIVGSNRRDSINRKLAQALVRLGAGKFDAAFAGGEAYVTFKADLIDEHGNIGDDGTKKFLADFVDRFADLVSRLAPAAAQASAA